MDVDLKPILKRLRRGETFHCETRDGATWWWMESPYVEIPPYEQVAIELKLKRYRIIPLGDGLFPEISQSYKMERRA